MNLSRLLHGVGLGIVLAASPAIAGNRNFTLINDTRNTIDGVWISTSDDNTWHATTGLEPIDPGSSASIVFAINDVTSPCILQLRVHLQNVGASIEWDKGFNFCQLHKVKVWYNYDDDSYHVTYY
jgi:hypothetical protein